MGAQLNIKSQKTRDLAVRLANLTGESLTDAVTRALEERIAREEARPRAKTPEEIQKRVADALALIDQIRANMKPGDRFDTDWLYDENGLPK